VNRPASAAERFRGRRRCIATWRRQPVARAWCMRPDPACGLRIGNRL